MKMRNICTLLIMFLFMMSVMGTVSALEIHIETDVSIIGTVIMDRDLSIETDPGWDGIKFYDNYWTPSLGMRGISNVSLDENIVLTVSNESILTVRGEFDGEYMKADACLRNYDVGTRQSNQYTGNTMIGYNWLASNVTSEMVFLGTFDGSQRSTILVRNTTCPHHTIYDEDLKIKGPAEIDLSSVIAVPVCVGEGDWLGCP